MEFTTFDNTTNAFNTSGDTFNSTELTSTQIVVLIDNNGVKAIREQFNIAQYVICPTLLIFGIIGNIFVIFTVSDAKFRRLTSRYILCALALSDSMLLLTNPFNQQFMKTIIDVDIRAFSSFGCKVFFVAYRTAKMSAAWFIVLVATERYVAVKYPLKVKQIMKKNNIIFSIILIFVVMIAFTSSWSFSVDIVDTRCVPEAVKPETVKLHKVFLIVASTTYSFVPIIILLTLTPPLIYTLLREHRRRKMIQQNTFNAFERSARETYRISLMLIGILVSFFVCVMPITLVLVITFWTNEPIFSSKIKEFIILSSVAQCFEQLNHSTNFLMYVLFSSQFRRRFLQKIGCSNSQHGPSFMMNSSRGEQPESKTSCTDISKISASQVSLGDLVMDD